ncbi:hypothetical protein IQ238_09880 [Pleurocapsales cyanobacterium LEGE 06147]|nr:hypothetical protein [Pleurocapsales cyanobacterium LEGE 06147]
MITTSRHFKTSSRISYSNWYFLPSILSGMAGIIIGFAIACQLGWV